MTVATWLFGVALSVAGLAGLGFYTAFVERSGRPPSWPLRALAAFLWLQAMYPILFAILEWIGPWAATTTARFGGDIAEIAPLAIAFVSIGLWIAAASLTAQLLQNMARRTLGLPTKPILLTVARPK